MNTTQITNSATLVSISFGLPRQSRELESAAADAEVKANAERGTVASSMFYFKRKDGDKKIDGLDKLKKFQGKWKREIEIIAPFPYAGNFRILPMKLLGRFHEINTKFIAEKKAVWQDWADEDYADWRQSAPVRMGSLYKPEDFPSLGDCKERFRVEVDTMLISPAEQWRRIATISEDLAATMEAASNEKVEAAVKAANAQTWKDVLGPLQNVITTFTKDKFKVHDSLIANILHIVEMVPALNLSNDPELNNLATRAKDVFSKITPDDLRKSAETRTMAMAQAQALVAEFEPFARKFA
jgi:hypothetical protein